MGRQKAKGTAFETRIVNAANATGVLEAARSANNAPGRDVDIRLLDGQLVIVEAKNRANLNVHKTLADTQRRHQALAAGAVVAWHRTSRKGDNSRMTPDGPTVAACTLDRMLRLLAIESVARHLAARPEDPDALELLQKVVDG